MSTKLDSTEEASSGWELCDVIKNYRKLLRLTQKDICENIKEYLEGLDSNSVNITQSALAKIEAGRAIKDSNVSRYFYDRILRADMEERVKVFSLVERIQECTTFLPQDIVELFYIETKKEFIDFLYLHIKKPNAIEKDINESALKIIEKRLERFPREIHFDIANFANKSEAANSTATLVLYLVYNYIVSQYFQTFNKEKYNTLPNEVKEMIELKQLKNDKFSKAFFKNVIDSIWCVLESKKEENPNWSRGVKFGLIYERNSDEKTKDAVVSKLLTFVRIIGFMLIEMSDMKEIFRFMIEPYTNGESIEIPAKLDLSFNYDDAKFMLSDHLNIVTFMFEMCHMFPRVEDINNKIVKRLESYSLNEQIINVDMIKEATRHIYEDKKLGYITKSYKLKTIYNMLDEAEYLEEKEERGEEVNHLSFASSTC